MIGDKQLKTNIKRMKIKIVNTLRATLGIILLPIFFTLFIADRFILALMPWMESTRLKNWLTNTELFMMSFLRVFVVSVLIVCYNLLIFILS